MADSELDLRTKRFEPASSYEALKSKSNSRKQIDIRGTSFDMRLTVLCSFLLE